MFEFCCEDLAHNHLDRGTWAADNPSLRWEYAALIVRLLLPTVVIPNKKGAGVVDVSTRARALQAQVREHFDWRDPSIERVWVACDEPSCGKWRTVPKADKPGDNDRWVCSDRDGTVCDVSPKPSTWFTLRGTR